LYDWEKSYDILKFFVFYSDLFVFTRSNLHSHRAPQRLFGTVFCPPLWTWQNNKELERATHTHMGPQKQQRSIFFQKKQLIEFLALTFPDPYHGYRMIQVIFVSVLWIVNARERTQSAVFRLFSPQEALLIVVL
jgi:hypothetical protein